MDGAQDDQRVLMEVLGALGGMQLPEEDQGIAGVGVQIPETVQGIFIKQQDIAAIGCRKTSDAIFA